MAIVILASVSKILSAIVYVIKRAKTYALYPRKIYNKDVRPWYPFNFILKTLTIIIYNTV